MVEAPPEDIPVTVPKSAANASTDDLSVTPEGPVANLSHVKTREVGVKVNPPFGVTIN